MREMKIKPSQKIINGFQCWDVVKGKQVLGTYITEAHARAIVVEHKISKYFGSKSHKSELESLTIC